jgi:thiamine biosynthesis lipoprotein ApbE
MTTSKEVLHTQGEWKINYKNFGEYEIHTDEWVIATVMGYDMPEEQAEANAELICKAVNERQQTESNMAAYKNMQIELLKAHTERQRLIDSNRELLSIISKLDTWHKLEDGVFTYTNPKHDGDQLAFDLQTAINNAKAIL